MSLCAPWRVHGSYEVCIFYGLMVLKSAICLIFILNEGQSLISFLPCSLNITCTVRRLISLQFALWGIHGPKTARATPQNEHIPRPFPILDTF